MKRKNNIDMVDGPLFKNIWRFLLPFVFSAIMQRLYNAADVIVIGRYAGETALASVGTSGSISAMFIDLFIGLSAGISVALGHALGAKDEERASRVIHTAMFVALVGGALVSVAGIVFAPWALSLVDVPADIMPQATLYMRIIFVGKIPVLVYNFGSAILRANGDSKRPLYIITVTGIANVLFNLFFVLVCGMKAGGVALATVIAQLGQAIAVTVLLCREEGAIKLRFKKLRIHRDAILNIIKVGIPSGLQATVFAGSNTLIQAGINSFGTATIAGNTAATNLGGFIYCVFNAFLHTALAFTSQNYGAKKYDRIGKTIRCCFADVVIFWAIAIVFVVFACRPLLGIYLPGNAAAVEKGMIRLWVMGCTYGILGFSSTMSGVLRSIGYSVHVMIVAVLGACVIRVIWILTVFEKFRTLPILYLSFAVSWIVSVIALSALYRVVRKKKFRDTESLQ